MTKFQIYVYYAWIFENVSRCYYIVQCRWKIERWWIQAGYSKVHLAESRWQDEGRVRVCKLLRGCPSFPNDRHGHDDGEQQSYCQYNSLLSILPHLKIEFFFLKQKFWRLWWINWWTIMKEQARNVTAFWKIWDAILWVWRGCYALPKPC